MEDVCNVLTTEDVIIWVWEIWIEELPSCFFRVGSGFLVFMRLQPVTLNPPTLDMLQTGEPAAGLAHWDRNLPPQQANITGGGEGGCRNAQPPWIEMDWWRISHISPPIRDRGHLEAQMPSPSPEVRDQLRWRVDERLPGMNKMLQYVSEVVIEIALLMLKYSTRSCYHVHASTVCVYYISLHS